MSFRQRLHSRLRGFVAFASFVRSLFSARGARSFAVVSSGKSGKIVKLAFISQSQGKRKVRGERKKSENNRKNVTEWISRIHTPLPPFYSSFFLVSGGNLERYKRVRLCNHNRAIIAGGFEFLLSIVPSIFLPISSRFSSNTVYPASSFFLLSFSNQSCVKNSRNEISSFLSRARS